MTLAAVGPAKGYVTPPWPSKAARGGYGNRERTNGAPEQGSLSDNPQQPGARGADVPVHVSGKC